jgi:hypothetical protein
MRRQNKKWGNFFHPESSKTDWRVCQPQNSGDDDERQQIESPKEEDYEEE